MSSHPPLRVRLARSRGTHVALLAALALGAYANSFGASFHFDDRLHIVQKRLVNAPGLLGDPARVVALFSGNPTRFVANLSFAVDAQLYGLDPRGFHVVNFCVHLAATLLVWRLALLLFRTPRLASSAMASRSNLVALLAAALFAAHPIQTQAVTYVVQRLASLSTALALAAVVAYVAARLRDEAAPRGRAWPLFAAAVAFSVLAMLTKESTFTLPALIGLAEGIFFAGPLRRRALRLLPFALTIPIIPAFQAAQQGTMADRIAAGGVSAQLMAGLTHYHYLLTEARVVVTYLRLLVWPTGQNLFYDYPI